MNLQKMKDMVRDFMSQGKDELDAIKLAEKSGLFDEPTIDAFWDEINDYRKRNQHRS